MKQKWNSAVRKVKKPTSVKEAKWEYEIGEQPVAANSQEALLKESSANVK